MERTKQICKLFSARDVTSHNSRQFNDFNFGSVINTVVELTVTMVNVKHVLLAILPVLTAPSPFRTPLAETQQNGILTKFTTVIQSFAISATAIANSYSPPLPDQGGQRITDEWLLSLSDRECLWRFR